MNHSIHPYDQFSSAYNFFFHPLHFKEKAITFTSVITNVALSIFTFGIWLVPFGIVNRLDNKNVKVWKKEQAIKVHLVALQNLFSSSTHVAKYHQVEKELKQLTLTNTLSLEKVQKILLDLYKEYQAAIYRLDHEESEKLQALINLLDPLKQELRTDNRITSLDLEIAKINCEEVIYKNPVTGKQYATPYDHCSVFGAQMSVSYNYELSNFYHLTDITKISTYSQYGNLTPMCDLVLYEKPKDQSYMNILKEFPKQEQILKKLDESGYCGFATFVTEEQLQSLGLPKESCQKYIAIAQFYYPLEEVNFELQDGKRPKFKKNI